MLEFRKADISDRAWANELLEKSGYMGCEYSFSNNIAWSRLSDSSVCRYKDFYIGISGGNAPMFTFPAGFGDYGEVLRQMHDYAKAMGKPFAIWNVTSDMLEILKQSFSENFTVNGNEDSSDYVYLAEDLISLSGKKLHSKRNHLKKFYEYDWSYEPVQKENFAECIEFLTLNYNEKNGIEDKSSVAEQFAINTYFTYFDELELKGGLLRVGGKIVAVTVGERLNKETFVVHIEKADTEYHGSYTAINNEFAKHAMRDYIYVNREEDLGIEGLRRAKRSYNPVFQVEKSIVIFKD